MVPVYLEHAILIALKFLCSDMGVRQQEGSFHLYFLNIGAAILLIPTATRPIKKKAAAPSPPASADATLAFVKHFLKKGQYDGDSSSLNRLHQEACPGGMQRALSAQSQQQVFMFTK